MEDVPLLTRRARGVANILYAHGHTGADWKGPLIKKRQPGTYSDQVCTRTGAVTRVLCIFLFFFPGLWSMFDFFSILGRFRQRHARKGTTRQAPGRPQLRLEAMEDRSLPSTVNVFALPAVNGVVPQIDQIVTLGSNLYFSTHSGEICRITTTAQTTENFALGGTDLATGPDGNLW